MPALNIFIDESGDFEFSPKGSRHFVLTAVTTAGCADLLHEFFRLKRDLAIEGQGIERFHATDDSIAVRNRFFDLIAAHVGHGCFKVDSVVLRKNRANPAIRDPETFYAMSLKWLLQWVFSRHTEGIDSVLVWTDLLPRRKKREVFEKTVKTYLVNSLKVHLPYRLHHHSSASDPCSRWRTTVAGLSRANGGASEAIPSRGYGPRSSASSTFLHRGRRSTTRKIDPPAYPRLRKSPGARSAGGYLYT